MNESSGSTGSSSGICERPASPPRASSPERTSAGCAPSVEPRASGRPAALAKDRVSATCLSHAAAALREFRPEGLPEMMGPSMLEVAKHLDGLRDRAERESPQPTQELRKRANSLAAWLGRKSGAAVREGSKVCGQFAPEDYRARRAADLTSALGSYFESAGTLIETAASGPAPLLAKAIARHGDDAGEVRTHLLRNGDPTHAQRAVATMPEDVRAAFGMLCEPPSPSGYR